MTPFGTHDTLNFQPFDVRKVLEEHRLTSVWDDHCDYPAEVQCSCDWKGTPDWYTEHLLFMSGLTSTMTQDWLSKFVGTGNAREYADLFDQPSVVKARKTIETKKRKEDKRIEKLHRMAANGDAEAAAEISAMEAHDGRD